MLFTARIFQCPIPSSALAKINLDRIPSRASGVRTGKKKVAVRNKMIYSVSVLLTIMKFDKILLIGGLIVAASLVLKSIKQFIYLSFTLLTLKFVWIVIMALFILMSLKKKTRSSREIKK